MEKPLKELQSWNALPQQLLHRHGKNIARYVTTHNNDLQISVTLEVIELLLKPGPDLSIGDIGAGLYALTTLI